MMRPPRLAASFVSATRAPVESDFSISIKQLFAIQDFCLKSPKRLDFEKVVAATWRFGTSKPAREPHSCASTISLLSWQFCSLGLASRCLGSQVQPPKHS